MSWFRRTWLTAVGQVAWRIPGRSARILSSFAQAERGSGFDMLSACEETTRRDMRRKFLEHSLDESRHSQIFVSCSRAAGGLSRAQAAIMDGAYLTNQGIVGDQSLFERLGDLEFMAFVYVAEQDAVEQFTVYRDHHLLDTKTAEILNEILRDEKFHVSYSRAELERYREEGRAKEVDQAIRRVRWRRIKEAWLRGSIHIGTFVTGLWMVLLYFLVVTPFRLFARMASGGWIEAKQPSGLAPTSMRAARSQA